MIKKLMKSFVLAFALFAQLAWADPTSTITSTLNYKVLTTKDVPANFNAPAGKILVLDFFSYGCPHCAALHPFIDQWLKQNAANIVPPVSTTKTNTANTSADKTKKKTPSPYIIFQPVPVSFEAGWDIYSKAYHMEQLLNLGRTLDDGIFNVAQNPLLGLNSDSQMRSFFLNNGVTANAFDLAAVNPALKQALQNDQQLMQGFKIMEIPTMIIADGKNVYYISNTTVKNADPKLFIATLTSLTSKRPS